VLIITTVSSRKRAIFSCSPVAGSRKASSDKAKGVLNQPIVIEKKARIHIGASMTSLFRVRGHRHAGRAARR
jgi:hypothetical protein